MKRHPAFQDLSRDHFTALNRSLQVIRAVEGHPMAMPYSDALSGLVALWRHGGLPAHFEEEEHDLVPVLQSRGDPGLAARLTLEHADLRGRLDAVAARTASPDQAAEAARRLMAHVRWEEDVVFEWLQANLDPGELAALLEKARSFRTARGLPVGTGRPDPA